VDLKGAAGKLLQPIGQFALARMNEEFPSLNEEQNLQNKT
jgi:hypothetical protein